MTSATDYKVDLEVCPIPLLLVAGTGAIVKTNDRLEALFGYERGELVGQPIEVLVPESIRLDHVALRDNFFQSPTKRSMGTGRDLHGVRKDGTKLPVEVGLEPIRFNDQQMIMVSVIDIRERKNAQATLRQALDAASSAMIQINADSVIELVNRQAGLLFGYEPKEMLGQPIELVIPARYHEAHIGYRNSYQASREARPMGSGRDLYGLKKDGSEFPVEIGLTPVHESAGKSTMATVIDITKRVQRSKEIQRKNEQLRRLNTELLEFAYSASHDLKAPLASMQGLLGICETDLDANDLEEVRTNIERSRALAQRLAGRVEDILKLAKSDGEVGDWQEVAIEQHITDAWQALPNDQVRFELSMQHESRLCTVPSRLDTILENLLSNAIRYQRPAEPQKRVTVTTADVGENLILSVEDNGIGIPPEHHQTIFRLFHRLSDGNTEGTGLGLPLARKNVLLLGGTLEVQSGNGTTAFIVTLPIEQPDLNVETT